MTNSPRTVAALYNGPVTCNVVGDLVRYDPEVAGGPAGLAEQLDPLTSWTGYTPRHLGHRS